MIKQGSIEAFSFKHGRVLVNGLWVKVSRDIDLKRLTKGVVYQMDVEKDFDENWFLISICALPLSEEQSNDIPIV